MLVLGLKNCNFSLKHDHFLRQQANPLAFRRRLLRGASCLVSICMGVMASQQALASVININTAIEQPAYTINPGDKVNINTGGSITAGAVTVGPAASIVMNAPLATINAGSININDGSVIDFSMGGGLNGNIVLGSNDIIHLHNAGAFFRGDVSGQLSGQGSIIIESPFVLGSLGTIGAKAPVAEVNITNGNLYIINSKTHKSLATNLGYNATLLVSSGNIPGPLDSQDVPVCHLIIAGTKSSFAQTTGSIGQRKPIGQITLGPNITLTLQHPTQTKFMTMGLGSSLNMVGGSLAGTVGSAYTLSPNNDVSLISTQADNMVLEKTFALRSLSLLNSQLTLYQSINVPTLSVATIGNPTSRLQILGGYAGNTVVNAAAAIISAGQLVIAQGGTFNVGQVQGYLSGIFLDNGTFNAQFIQMKGAYPINIQGASKASIGQLLLSSSTSSRTNGPTLTIDASSSFSGDTLLVDASTINLFGAIHVGKLLATKANPSNGFSMINLYSSDLTPSINGDTDIQLLKSMPIGFPIGDQAAVNDITIGHAPIQLTFNNIVKGRKIQIGIGASLLVNAPLKGFDITLNQGSTLSLNSTVDFANKELTFYNSYDCTVNILPSVSELNASIVYRDPWPYYFLTSGILNILDRKEPLRQITLNGGVRASSGFSESDFYVDQANIGNHTDLIWRGDLRLNSLALASDATITMAQAHSEYRVWSGTLLGPYNKLVLDGDGVVLKSWVYGYGEKAAQGMIEVRSSATSEGGIGPYNNYGKSPLESLTIWPGATLFVSNDYLVSQTKLLNPSNSLGQPEIDFNAGFFFPGSPANFYCPYPGLGCNTLGSIGAVEFAPGGIGSVVISTILDTAGALNLGWNNSRPSPLKSITVSHSNGLVISDRAYANTTFVYPHSVLGINLNGYLYGGIDGSEPNVGELRIKNPNFLKEMQAGGFSIGQNNPLKSVFLYPGVSIPVGFNIHAETIWPIQGWEDFVPNRSLTISETLSSESGRLNALIQNALCYETLDPFTLSFYPGTAPGVGSVIFNASQNIVRHDNYNGDTGERGVGWACPVYAYVLNDYVRVSASLLTFFGDTLVLGQGAEFVSDQGYSFRHVFNGRVDGVTDYQGIWKISSAQGNLGSTNVFDANSSIGSTHPLKEIWLLNALNFRAFASVSAQTIILTPSTHFRIYLDQQSFISSFRSESDWQGEIDIYGKNTTFYGALGNKGGLGNIAMDGVSADIYSDTINATNIIIRNSGKLTSHQPLTISANQILLGSSSRLDLKAPTVLNGLVQPVPEEVTGGVITFNDTLSIGQSVFGVSIDSVQDCKGVLYVNATTPSSIVDLSTSSIGDTYSIGQLNLLRGTMYLGKSRYCALNISPRSNLVLMPGSNISYQVLKPENCLPDGSENLGLNGIYVLGAQIGDIDCPYNSITVYGNTTLDNTRVYANVVQLSWWGWYTPATLTLQEGAKLYASHITNPEPGNKLILKNAFMNVSQIGDSGYFAPPLTALNSIIVTNTIGMGDVSHLLTNSTLLVQNDVTCTSSTMLHLEQNSFISAANIFGPSIYSSDSQLAINKTFAGSLQLTHSTVTANVSIIDILALDSGSQAKMNQLLILNPNSPLLIYNSELDVAHPFACNSLSLYYSQVNTPQITVGGPTSPPIRLDFVDSQITEGGFLMLQDTQDPTVSLTIMRITETQDFALRFPVSGPPPSIASSPQGEIQIGEQAAHSVTVRCTDNGGIGVPYPIKRLHIAEGHFYLNRGFVNADSVELDWGGYMTVGSPDGPNGLTINAPLVSSSWVPCGWVNITRHFVNLKTTGLLGTTSRPIGFINVMADQEFRAFQPVSCANMILGNNAKFIIQYVNSPSLPDLLTINGDSDYNGMIMLTPDAGLFTKGDIGASHPLNTIFLSSTNQFYVSHNVNAQDIRLGNACDLFIAKSGMTVKAAISGFGRLIVLTDVIGPNSIIGQTSYGLGAPLRKIEINTAKRLTLKADVNATEFETYGGQLALGGDNRAWYSLQSMQFGPASQLVLGANNVTITNGTLEIRESSISTTLHSDEIWGVGMIIYQGAAIPNLTSSTIQLDTQGYTITSGKKFVFMLSPQDPLIMGLKVAPGTGWNWNVTVENDHSISLTASTAEGGRLRRLSTDDRTIYEQRNAESAVPAVIPPEQSKRQLRGDGLEPDSKVSWVLQKLFSWLKITPSSTVKDDDLLLPLPVPTPRKTNSENIEGNLNVPAH